MADDVRIAVPSGDHLGEGAFWDVGRGLLWWLDVPLPSRLHSLDPATGATRHYDMPEMISSMRALKDGSGLVIAGHGGISFFDPARGAFRRVLDPEPMLPFNRCNDGGTDARGRFWFGTMQNNVAPNGAGIDIVAASGSLYRLDPDLSLTAVAGGIMISNTVCWSPDSRTMYFSDTATETISAYDFDLEAGTVSGRRDFARFDRGAPDGSTVDAEGYLWNARWDGNCVVRFAPDGSVDRVIELPVARPTSVAFGGPGLGTLYITSGRYGLDADGRARQPLAGHLFACEPGVRGLPAPPFG